eukprot:m.240120 g.240120  ORF g.240120 m.240120 type:complete len:489 (+) comp13613_c0_seq1:68-1534(+)
MEPDTVPEMPSGIASTADVPTHAVPDMDAEHPMNTSSETDMIYGDASKPEQFSPTPDPDTHDDEFALSGMDQDLSQTPEPVASIADEPSDMPALEEAADPAAPPTADELPDEQPAHAERMPTSIQLPEEPVSPVSPMPPAPTPAERSVSLEEVSLHDQSAAPSTGPAPQVPAPAMRPQVPPLSPTQSPMNTTPSPCTSLPMSPMHGRPLPPARAAPPQPVKPAGVVILGKPSTAVATRKKAATGFMHNAKLELYMARVRLQEKFSATSPAADNVLASHMQALQAMDTSYAQLSEIAATYKKNMDEFREAEVALAKFMEDRGMKDPTPVGEIMRSLSTALKGQASAHAAKLTTPVNALVDDFKTFNNHVVADTSLTIEKMEKARLEYDAYKLWMKDVDVDKTKNPPRYEAVNTHFRAAQQAYTKLRQDSVTKVMMVQDHRLKMTSAALRKYHAALASHYSCSASLFRNVVVKHKEIHSADPVAAVLVEG